MKCHDIFVFMKNLYDDSLPWPKINEHILRLGLASSKQELIEFAIEDVGALIPYDTCASIFDVGRKHLYGEGLSDTANKHYNEYYRFIQPPFSSLGGPTFPYIYFMQLRTFTFRDYADSEFYLDFARPNGMEYALATPLPGAKLAINFIRSRRGSSYSDREVQICKILNSHLNNLYSIFDRAIASGARLPSTEAIQEKFSSLSRREAEVGQYLCRGFTAPEIASKLFLSERTVETHVSHIYAKLEVRTRRDAVAHLNTAL